MKPSGIENKHARDFSEELLQSFIVFSGARSVSHLGADSQPDTISTADASATFARVTDMGEAPRVTAGNSVWRKPLTGFEIGILNNISNVEVFHFVRLALP